MINRISSKIKLYYKTKLFHQKATCGKNFVITPEAYCDAPDKTRLVFGDNCEILGRILVLGDGKVCIGNNTTIRYGSKVISVCGVEIGNNVIISNNVRIYDNNSHPTDPQKRMEMSASGFHSKLWSCTLSEQSPVVIEDNVWIGEHSAILKGVHIGKGSVVACDSVVTKDVPPYSIVAGNPARVVKKIEGYEV